MSKKPKRTPGPKSLSVSLRALDVSDIDRTYCWHNDASLYETLGDPFRPVSRASETDWLRQKASFSKEELNLAICLNRTGEHIGNIYLRDIDWVARTAELHVFIGSDTHRGKGYGQEAIRQLLHCAFHDMNLNRVILNVLADNVAAVNTYEKCGFELEGRLKEHSFKLGQYKDVLVMGITSGKYKQLEVEK